MAPAKYDRGIDARHGGPLCDQPRHPESAGRGLRPGKLVQRVQAVALQWEKDAQLCGIAIYFEGKGFITKWDGAEDSDIEPIKGGLSDSMKRAAYQWGIGRVLYSLDTVWVDIERRGRSYIIKASERKSWMTLI